MPHIIAGDQRTVREPLATAHYDYQYPEDLNLKPGTPKHDMLRDEILERARQSHTAISNRFSSWNEIDRVLNTYVELDTEEKEVKKKDGRKPVSIVFPYSYAIHETLVTYLMSAFVQEPIFRYEGASPGDVIGAILMEKVIQRQALKHKVPLAMHTYFRDALAYGVGYASPIWEVRHGTRRIRQTEGRFDEYGRIVGRMPEEFEEQGILFEGNSLMNIDPYLALPDPRVSSHNIQKGEFFGWIEETNVIGLLEDERSNEDYFNARYAKHLRYGRSSIRNQSQREVKTTRDAELSYSVSSPLDVIHMYVNIVPADWGLGDGDYPEKWMFALAGDQVIVKAKPLGLNHGMYPVGAISPDYDGYSALPLSRMESVYGLQHVVDWLFNSHVTNVRKAINDMFVVDPYLINLEDMKSPEPGKLIRMRRPGWGKGVRDAVMQLGVTDITRQNIEDTAYIVQWMNNVAGADESMMGAMRQGGPERLTAQEFQGTRGSALSRLERMAQVIGLQGMQDIGYMFASHLQQLMSEEAYISIKGEWQERLKKEYGVSGDDDRVKVRPDQLDIDYDVIVRDGSVPGSNMSQSWVDLFQIVSQDPELRQRFDVVRIFKHIARGLGAKNVEEFKIKHMDDEQVMRGLERGDLAPADQAVPGREG